MTTRTPRIPFKARDTSRATRAGWFAVLLTSIAVPVYFPSQYVNGLEAAAKTGHGLGAVYVGDALPVRIAFFTHITAGGLALLIGGFQFSRWIRRKHIRVHRAIGRTYVAAVMVGSIAAFVIAFFNSVALLGFFGFGTLAILWNFTTVKAYRAVRRGDIRSHQAWAIRSFALTYAAPMLRIWFILGMIALSVFAHKLSSGEVQAYAYAPVPFLCWVPNIVLAEIIIARKGLPGLRFSSAGPATPSPATAID